jgi:hypothetical protein
MPVGLYDYGAGDACARTSIAGALGCAEERMRGELLPPSSGPTQVGTTPNLSFHAVVSANGKLEVEIVH